MKIIINTCYGGFSVSRRGFLRLRELGEKTAIAEPDYGEYWSDGSGPRTTILSMNVGSFCRDIPRDSPLLIRVIEELGSRAVSGDFASLTIVEIPDGVDWTIKEYDGNEWVAEKHRTWR